ncbi:MAG: hypothetical protein LBK60_08810 [Verrucomicrobiales bacterium]|nr:hypothetical protein [Verrucomicrobiales bacterium]
MDTQKIIFEHLKKLGVNRPQPALVDAIDARLADSVGQFIIKRATRRLVAKTFAALLAWPGGSKGDASASPLASNIGADEVSPENRNSGNV